jgi:hypothetical protein
MIDTRNCTKQVMKVMLPVAVAGSVLYKTQLIFTKHTHSLKLKKKKTASTGDGGDAASGGSSDDVSSGSDDDDDDDDDDAYTPSTTLSSVCGASMSFIFVFCSVVRALRSLLTTTYAPFFTKKRRARRPGSKRTVVAVDDNRQQRCHSLQWRRSNAGA